MSPTSRFSPGIPPILALLVLLAVPLAAQFPQQEFPVAVTEGQEPVTLAYGQYTTGALIDSAGDADSYDFFHTQGESVVIILRKLDGSTGADPRIRVLDLTAGTFIPGLDSFCNGNSPSPGNPSIPCTHTVTFSGGMTARATGWYRVFVSDQGNNEPTPGQSGQPYRIRIETLPGQLSAAMGYGVTVTDDIAPVTDTDTLTFQASAGSLVDVNLSQFTGSLDPHIQIIDPMGNVLADQACSGNSPSPGNPPIPCSIMIPALSLPVAGTYSILIWDDGYNETGTYNLDIQCLFGNCPGAPAPLTLTLSAPQGPGSLQFDNTNGTAGDWYVSVFSFDPANAGPAAGWWGGLFVALPDLLFQVNIGRPPFYGILDSSGASSFSFSSGIPVGLGPLYGVTMTFPPSFNVVSATSARTSIVL